MSKITMLKKVGLIFLILIIGFVVGKGFIGSAVKLKEKKVYEKINENGQIDSVFIISSNNIIFSKNLEGSFEFAHFFVRGSSASHYIGSLYNLGTFPFGLRIISNAESVWIVELELLNKFGTVSESTFDDVGTKYKVILIEYDNSISINNDTYSLIDFQEKDLKRVKDILTDKK